MAKTVKTRIQHKRETAANWTSATSFKPMDGELIVYKPDTTGSPAMLKVGDGSTVAKDLPFIKAGSATTADSATKATQDGDGNTITSTYVKNAVLTSHTVNTAAHITADERTKWNNASTHASSTHAPTNAEKNQNAFSNIKVGSTTVAADSTTDTLTLAAGSNVTITPDTNADTITIAATNTTYSAGTGISLSGTTFSNSGVRSVGTGTTDGTISVNTNGTTANVAVKGLGSAAYTASSTYAAASHTHSGYAASSHNHNYLPLAGGNLSGHIYLTGAKPASSTGSTSQIVFGTSSDQHVAISSNSKAIVINPNTTTTTNQIVLYLDKASQFPSGISGNLYGNASTATKFASSQSVALTGDVTGSASSQAGWSVATTLANSGVTAGSYGPSANASPAHGNTFSVPYITVDAKGRVTSASTKTITLPADTNTHYTTGITTGASGTTSNSAISNPYIKIKDDSTHRSQIQLKGSGTTTVSSDANGVITISSVEPVFYATLTNNMGAYLSDVTYAQIKAAYDAGNCIYCKVIGADDYGMIYSDFCLPLTRLGANSFIFQGIFETLDEEAYNVVKSITVTISSASNNVEFSTISSPQIYDLIEEKTQVKMKIWTESDMGGA